MKRILFLLTLLAAPGLHSMQQQPQGPTPMMVVYGSIVQTVNAPMILMPPMNQMMQQPQQPFAGFPYGAPPAYPMQQPADLSAAQAKPKEDMQKQQSPAQKKGYTCKYCPAREPVRQSTAVLTHFDRIHSRQKDLVRGYVVNGKFVPKKKYELKSRGGWYYCPEKNCSFKSQAHSGVVIHIDIKHPECSTETQSTSNSTPKLTTDNISPLLSAQQPANQSSSSNNAQPAQMDTTDHTPAPQPAAHQNAAPNNNLGGLARPAPLPDLSQLASLANAASLSAPLDTLAQPMEDDAESAKVVSESGEAAALALFDLTKKTTTAQANGNASSNSKASDNSYKPENAVKTRRELRKPKPYSSQKPQQAKFQCFVENCCSTFDNADELGVHIESHFIK